MIEKQFVVLQVDVRGSVGHGREFREHLLRNFGGIDVEDLHSGAEYLRTLAYVDMDRLGIWGSSYGGLMTTMSLFKKPGVYKAGVASAPATNLWHATTGEVRAARRPDCDPEVFRKDAPSASYGENLQDHLLIIHGMQDDIVLFKDYGHARRKAHDAREEIRPRGPAELGPSLVYPRLHGRFRAAEDRRILRAAPGGGAALKLPWAESAAAPSRTTPSATE